METIFGVFNERVDADRAIYELEENYFDPKDISIIAKEREQVVTKRRTTEENVVVGAAEGATAGGVIGGLTGLLIGSGILTIPGIGVFFIGGPIALALGLTGVAALAVSAATTGVIAGGVLGALVGLGVPKKDARVFERYINEGAILLALQTQTRKESDQVRAIFKKHNSMQIRTISSDSGIRYSERR